MRHAATHMTNSIVFSANAPVVSRLRLSGNTAANLQVNACEIRSPLDSDELGAGSIARIARKLDREARRSCPRRARCRPGPAAANFSARPGESGAARISFHCTTGTSRQSRRLFRIPERLEVNVAHHQCGNGSLAGGACAAEPVFCAVAGAEAANVRNAKRPTAPARPERATRTVISFNRMQDPFALKPASGSG